MLTTALDRNVLKFDLTRKRPGPRIARFAAKGGIASSASSNAFPRCTLEGVQACHSRVAAWPAGACGAPPPWKGPRRAPSASTQRSEPDIDTPATTARRGEEFDHPFLTGCT